MLMIIAILKLGMRLRMIFSYHQFQDVVCDYWRHLSKLTCMSSFWFSRRFVVFYCLTTEKFFMIIDATFPRQERLRLMLLLSVNA